MKLLLANHHLRDRAGSEIYTCELASEFARRGHEVGVFTLLRGPLADRLEERGVRVFDVGDRARIEAFAPDVLHVHHAPCLYALGAMRLNARVVFSSLGVIPVLEAPPAIFAGVGRGLAVSEEVRARLEDSAFGKSVPLAIFRNWFDDTDRLPPSGPERRREVGRVAVVTNHFDDTLRAHLGALTRRHVGFEWVHFGMPENSIEMTASVLEPFDALITIGRTALLAGSLGKPVLLYDVHGCDGWLTADRLPALATCNFSGRLTRGRPSLDELEHALFVEAPRLGVEAVTAALWRDYRLSSRVDTLLELYLELERGPRLDEAARVSYGRTGELYLEPLREAEARREETALLHRLLGDHRRRLADLDAELLSERTRLQAELEASRGQLHALRGAAENVHRELERVRAEHEQVVESAAWRSVWAIRGVKDRVLPMGTRRRRVYDRGLEWLKDPNSRR